MDFRSAKRFIPALFLAFAMSPAVAQQPPAGDSGTKTTDGTLALKRGVPPTYAAQKAEAERLIQGMKTAANTIASILWKARGSENAEQKLCANEKSSEANTTVRSAEERLKALSAAEGDPATSEYEFVIVRSHAERMPSLLAEARVCLGGEELSIVGGTVVDSTVDPDIPTDEGLTGFVEGGGGGGSGSTTDLPRCTSCN